MNNNESMNQTTTQIKKEKSKIIKFIKKHKGATFFFLLLLVAVVWGLISSYQLKKENEALVVKYEAMLDSVRTADYVLTSQVLSWAIRSDMLRNNYEQASLYAEEIIKHPNVIKVYAIDVKSKKIIISSEKKEVGLPIADMTLLTSKKSVVDKTNGIKRFTTPFTGLNNDIGLLVTEIRID